MLATTENSNLIILDSEGKVETAICDDMTLRSLVADAGCFLAESELAQHFDIEEKLDASQKRINSSVVFVLELPSQKKFGVNIRAHRNRQGSVDRFVLRFEDIRHREQLFHYFDFMQRNQHKGVWQYNLAEGHFLTSNYALELFKIPSRTPANIALNLVPFTSRSLHKFKKLIRDSELGCEFKETLELKIGDDSTWLQIQGEHCLGDSSQEHIIGLVSDITDELIHQEQIELAIEVGEIGLWKLDLRRDQLTWSEQMFRLYGEHEHPEEMNYEFWVKHVHPDDLSDTENAFKSAIEHRSRFISTFRIVCVSGQIKYVRAHAKTICNDANQPVMVIGINVDITDLKKEENRVYEEREARFASERLASIGELAAGIGHEINNPLAIIMGQLELMEYDFVRGDCGLDDLSQRLPVVRNASGRIRDIVSSLKALSRDERQDEYVDVDLNEVLATTESFTKQLYQQATISLKFHYEKLPCLVKGHIGELQQVLLNLIGNARDALDEQSNPTINVSLESNGSKAIIKVEDNGTGIEADKVNTIFNAFFTTKPTGKGTGLGLSIVKRIITNHRGLVTVQSTLGKGSLFTVTLPQSLTTYSPKTIKDKGQALQLNGKKIIIVDDETEFLSLCESYFAHLGAETSCYSSYETALKSIDNLMGGILISDLRLKDNTGIELVGSLREKLGYEFDAILMTGGSFTPNERQEIELYFNETISKPFSFKQLANKMAQLLDSTHGDEH